MTKESSTTTSRDLGSVFFPEQPRSFPYRRTLRIALRSGHILAGGVLMGGYVFAVGDELLTRWWLATMVSGLLLFLTDLHASFAVLVEVRGVGVVLKLLLVLLMPLAAGAAPVLLAMALVIGAVSSHMPRRYRHHVLWLRGRVIPDERRG